MRTEEKHKRKQEGSLLITIGLLLIAAAFILVSYNVYDKMRAEKSARQVVNKLEEYLPSASALEAPADPAGNQEPLIRDEQIVIPDYVLSPNMEMPVISEWNYPNLKTAPCRYSGSAYLNNLIICAHNYTSHFGNLKYLREGDIATFTDMDGNVFTYKMVERETLLPTSVDTMKNGDWDLTLFTCTVDGQSRVTIRFELKED